MRTFSCRIESSLVDLLAGPGGPFENDAPRITLWWRDGEARVTVEGAANLDAESRGRLAGLIEPLHEMILPMRPSRALVAHAFRFLPADDPWVRVGERGIEAVARQSGDDPVRQRIAIGPGGLVTRDRIERADGSVSEFTYEHALKDGRYLLTSTTGVFRDMKVSVVIEWGMAVAGRPLPTRIEVDQRPVDETGEALPAGLASQVFRLSRHQINGEIPASVLPRGPAVTPSLDPGPARK